jgi:hypothetical protein
MRADAGGLHLGPRELAAGHATSSSLTVKEAGATAGDGSLSREHTLQTS